jgi:hypothetical protein
MSRLLFAAARGARIEGSYKEFDIWNSVSAVRFDNFYDYRIHPNDEHLQYGPISTALREMAESSKANVYVFPHFPPYFGFGVEHQTQAEVDSARASDELTHSLFYLILAECLADSGL